MTTYLPSSRAIGFRRQRPLVTETIEVRARCHDHHEWMTTATMSWRQTGSRQPKKTFELTSPDCPRCRAPFCSFSDLRHG